MKFLTLKGLINMATITADTGEQLKFDPAKYDLEGMEITRYTGNNLDALETLGATYAGTLLQWNARGLSVCKGSKGLRLERVVLVDAEKDGKPVIDSDGNVCKRKRVKRFYVFTETQVQPQRVPKSRLKALAAA